MPTKARFNKENDEKQVVVVDVVQELTNLFQFGLIDGGEELEGAAPLVHRLVVVAKHNRAFANVGACCNANQSFASTTREDHNARPASPV